MKLFAVGDLHADDALKDAVVNEVNTNEYDLFLGLGDYETKAYYREFAEQLDVTHISCTGNWDFMGEPPENNEFEFLYNYAKVDFDPFKIVLLGGVYPEMPRLKQELREFLADTPREQVIFASHYPPHMLCDLADLGNHAGRPEFKELLHRFKPVLWFCGHIHEAAGINKYSNTIGVNAAAADTPNGYSITVTENGVETITAVNLRTGDRSQCDIPT